MHSTHIKTGQAVPAEDVLAPLAHHLCTALVLLDGHRAHGAAFDELIIEWYSNIILAIGNQATSEFLAAYVGMVLQGQVEGQGIYIRLSLQAINLSYVYRPHSSLPPLSLSLYLPLLTAFLQSAQNSSLQEGQCTHSDSSGVAASCCGV